MQLLTVTPGSGKLGGAVSTQTRTGSRLHARSARIQPRTTRQVAARALTGSLATITTITFSNNYIAVNVYCGCSGSRSIKSTYWTT